MTAIATRSRRRRRSPEFMSNVYNMMDIGLKFIEAVKHVASTSDEWTDRQAEKDAERERKEGLLATWKACCPLGTRIAVRLVRGGEEFASATRSAAWMLSSDEPVVLIEGTTGGHSLEFMRALGADEMAPPKHLRDRHGATS